MFASSVPGSFLSSLFHLILFCFVLVFLVRASISLSLLSFSVAAPSPPMLLVFLLLNLCPLTQVLIINLKGRKWQYKMRDVRRMVAARLGVADETAIVLKRINTRFVFFGYFFFFFFLVDDDLLRLS